MKLRYRAGCARLLRSLFPYMGGLAVSVLSICGCGPQPLDSAGNQTRQFAAVATILNTEYIPDSGAIRISWSKPDTDILYYILYRTNIRDLYGNYDPDALQERAYISREKTEYADVVGVANDVYFYGMKAVIRDGVHGDEVAGPMSNIDSCDIRNQLTLLINNGDLFVVVDTCYLTMIDGSSIIQTVRFTDSLVRTSSGADSVVWLDANANPRNPKVDYSKSDLTASPPKWVLPKGNKEKVVYAKIKTVTDKDTIIKDDIRIRPYRIAIKLRNSSDLVDPERSMTVPAVKASTEAGQVDQYNICKPFLDYSISIFNDSTFAKEFDFWLVTTDSIQNVKDLQTHKIDTTKAWLKLDVSWIETSPEQESLIDYGSAHDEKYIYRYSFDTISAEGRKNLSQFRKSILRPGSKALIDGFSTIAGNFWGAHDTVIGRDSSRVFANINPYYLYNKFIYLPSNLKKNGSLKEMVMVVRLKGRYFNDIRTFISTPNVNKNATFLTNMGFYPPFVARHGFEFVYPEDGEILKGINNFNTNTSGSVGGGMFTGYINCNSGARVASIELLFAQMPDNVSRIWLPDKPPVDIIDSLLKWPHTIFPFYVSGKPVAIAGGSWKNIDVQNWVPGNYLMAIISKDEFGNQGVAPYKIAGGAGLKMNTFNPQRVIISSR